MILEIILTKTLEAGIGLLVESGFGDQVRDLKERLAKTEEKKRRAAFDQAYDAAKTAFKKVMQSDSDKEIESLLDHQPFKEEVITALLDPNCGFEVDRAAQGWQGRLPEHTLALRRFFTALQSSLTNDPTWGPVLDRYQNLKLHQAVQEALRQRNPPTTERMLVQQVVAIHYGSGPIIQGPGAIIIQGNVYLGPQPRDPQEALRIYRQVLVAATANLPLRGIDVKASDPTAAQGQVGLENVYIDLDTKTQIKIEEDKKDKTDRSAPGEAKTRSLPALEATVNHQRLVLLGDPGSGKTTFVNFLAHCLAAHTLQPKAGWLKQLTCWPESEAGILPMVVILRDFARSLPKKLPEQAAPRHLWDFITSRLKAQNLSSASRAIHQVLEEGKALLLLDGLDEVPTLAQRIFIRDAINALIQRYPGNRYLVTCRVLSYQPPKTDQEPDLRMDSWPEFELAPFDSGRIDRFIRAWYIELARLRTVNKADALIFAKRLQEAVRRPDLWRLAPNPLLLTVMALVHTHQGRLPDTRAMLYEETVDILLWRWEQIKTGDLDGGPHLRQLLLDARRTDMDVKRILWELAYEAHAQVGGEEKLADISELRLEKALAALHGGDRNWAAQVIETMKLRAGLLLERAPGIFTFPHRTFQEYLAGAHLASQGNFAACAAQLGKAGAQWREVILLAVGRLVYLSGELAKPLALASELCPSQVDESQDTIWMQAWLAGDVLLEMGLNRVQDSALGRDLLERVQRRLQDLLEKGKLAPLERGRAGRTLAKLGDPRRSVTTLEGMVFCWVPPGSFWMGSDKKHDPDAFDDEQPRHRLELDGFWIARFPLTNVQFAAFVSAEGYRQRQYWSEAEKEGFWQNGAFKGGWDDEARNGPVDYGEPFNLPNHPVVGVSWYEALAFTRWLEEAWKKQGLLHENWTVQLPSEAQWEKAARGGLQIPYSPIIQPAENGFALPAETIAWRDNSTQIYPWEGDFNPDKANTSESGIGSTSAVGCFPRGASLYGALDLSGNVWEWTRSLWGKDFQKTEYKYPYNKKDGREDLSAPANTFRVLRGGSYGHLRWNARCAFRDGCHPDVRYNYDLGLRVVVCPL